MIKAILVMDNMPENCRKCDLRVIGAYNFCTGAGGRKIDQMKIINEDIKPDWCPLREVPQKKDYDYCDRSIWTHERIGYNACIDEILKAGAE